MYLSILASAVAACLPLVPVCLVAVPAALQLLAQVTWWRIHNGIRRLVVALRQWQE